MNNKTVNILLVEDDNVDSQGVLRSFKKFKIANPLFRAHDGVEALEILRGTEGKKKIPRPHLLLVDLNMPRMGGIELIKKMREDEELKNTVIFVLTTSKSADDRLSAYNLNIAGYIVKENVGDDFIKMIQMLDCYWKVIEFP